ncbi:integrase-recombinase protein [Rhodopirellula sallentina SM41]|uniref:Integrase-recombinase protein n=1 Tax=Rhodopirellula sallentina SM41 TaxID=1263870 RepID=M5TZQ5_9BACT|nr:integrase-recombinase protein [Rhodopirellula sallentina SM41]
MASVFKKTYVRPMPANAEIVSRQGKQIARWTDGKGRKRSAEVTTGKDGSPRIKTEASTYTAKYRDGEGIVREVATGCRDKQAAKTKLAELLSIADKVRVGSITTTDLKIGDHNKIPLADHIAQYITDLKTRGVNADRIKTSETRLKAACDGCGFRWLRDLNADALRKWLRGQPEMSAATYNWHVTLWTAFGNWLTGIRLQGKRPSQTGERRLTSNPFDGFGKRDEKSDRKRVARSLTRDEMQRLLDIAQRRPLQDALTVRRGKNAGKQVAKVPDARRAKLERLGTERALIYKTLILTGLRSNELRTLRKSDLSFGDVPFLILKSSNEKNRKGSTVPLKSDLAADLRAWVADKAPGDLIFNVPTGLLRILNRDLIAAGIDKVDENEGRIHLHALRHSTGTHLSAAGVSPRTAQAVMRHSDIALTMNTYTDERLLETSAAVEHLPTLSVSSDAPMDAPNPVQAGQNSPSLTESDKATRDRESTKKPSDSQGMLSFRKWAIENSNLWPLPCESSALTN